MNVTVTGSSRADFAQCQQVKRCAEAFTNDLQVCLYFGLGQHTIPQMS